MMRTKATHTLLTLALAAVLAMPATAQLGNLDRVGELGGVPNLQAMVKEALSGRAPEGVTVDELDGGFLRITVPLRQGSPVLRQKMAKDLLGVAIHVSLSELDFVGQLLTFDAAPLPNFEYFAGWVTINQGTNDITARSSIKTKGPGPDINSGNQDLPYAASAFNIFVTTTGNPGFDGGIHNIQVKVQGQKPGKLQGHFCVDCV